CALRATSFTSARTHATYVARPDVSSLLSYAYRSGMWNAITLRINAACMKLRHFAPLALVLVNVTLLLAALTSVLMNHSGLLPLSLLLLVLGSHLLLGIIAGVRSEEHTSELQSLAYLVCRLLLEK